LEHFISKIEMGSRGGLFDGECPIYILLCPKSKTSFQFKSRG